MNNTKLVSVIIPVYNVEQYITRCLNSIQNQTYRNLEIVVIDDGSQDNCPQIIDELAEGDSRFKVIHQKNLGVAEARNRGLFAATGDYIAFVDSDDFIMPLMIETLVKGMELENVDLAIVEAVNCEEDVNNYGSVHLLSTVDALEGIFSGSRKLRVTIWNKLFKRELIGNMKLEQNAALAEDVLFLVKYIKRVRRIAYIDSPLYVYELRNGSIVRGGSKEKLVVEKPLIDCRIVEEVSRYAPDLKSMMLNWAISDCIVWRSRLKSRSAIRNMKKKSYMLRKNVWLAKDLYWKTKILYFLGVI